MNENPDRRDEHRREDDREWIRSVDHQLVTILTGHQVLDRRLAELEEAIQDIDLLLRGDPSEDMDGIVTQLHQVQRELSRLNAVIFVDSTGRKGLQKEVDDLKAGEHRAEYHLKFWAPIIAAFISLSVPLITNWARITAFVKRPDNDPVDQMIDEAAHSKPKHRHYRIDNTQETEP